MWITKKIHQMWQNYTTFVFVIYNTTHSDFIIRKATITKQDLHWRYGNSTTQTLTINENHQQHKMWLLTPLHATTYIVEYKASVKNLDRMSTISDHIRGLPRHKIKTLSSNCKTLGKSKDVCDELILLQDERTQYDF